MAKLNPYLRKFWKTKADLKVLKGGRASSKTYDATGMAIYLASKYKVKFLCMRQFQSKIAESVYAILKFRIEEFGMTDQFEILKTVIRHRKTGSEFHFYGIHRNIAEIKGFEGADIGWIEEAEGLTKEQWTVIEPTLRKEGAECWLLYNPRMVTDFVETFVTDKKNSVLVQTINYDQNPFLSSSMLRKINRLKEADIEEYEHIYRGIPRTDDNRAVIKRSWIEASIDAHIKLGIEISGKKTCGFDVGDTGDLCSQIHRHGILAHWGEHWKGKQDEILKSCTRVYAKAIELDSHVTYDCIGVGATVGAKFQEMNDERSADGQSKMVSYSKFNAGGSVLNPDRAYSESEHETITNKEMFSNLKAQTWIDVSNLFCNTYNAVINGHVFADEQLISISSDMPNLSQLITELSTPKRDEDKLGKLKVESKKDLAKRYVDSPNDADAFIMAYARTEEDGMSDLFRMSAEQ